ncbi:MAG: hypothetical protein OJF49_003202 [Ktedonobacterales bacterium]|nr:MAG: hypothetical protein OJF49_003202 [Ktedonobacterales bacterium]
MLISCSCHACARGSHMATPTSPALLTRTPHPHSSHPRARAECQT